MHNLSITPVGVVVFLEEHPICPIARGQADEPSCVVRVVFTRRFGAGIPCGVPGGEFFALNGEEGGRGRASHCSLLSLLVQPVGRRRQARNRQIQPSEEEIRS